MEAEEALIVRLMEAEEALIVRLVEVEEGVVRKVRRMKLQQPR
jgi:hypothetical protein